MMSDDDDDAEETGDLLLCLDAHSPKSEFRPSRRHPFIYLVKDDAVKCSQALLVSLLILTFFTFSLSFRQQIRSGQ